MVDWYLGTIGFSYKEWVGEFYPTGTSPREYLPYYCKIFNSVEIDTTFHSIPRTTMVESWFTTTPPAFKFCLKTPRAITHEHGLISAQSLMNEFLDTLNPLQEKIGPILIQLPPSYSQSYLSVFAEFLQSLPVSHRYAIEFRHLSWYNDNTARLLSDHNVCLASIDYPNLPAKIYPTTDFLYIRWIGVNGMYHRHSYERADKTSQLTRWLGELNRLKEQVSAIYGFFNNDYAGFAAGTCRRFLRLAGLIDEEKDAPYQERLF